MTTYYINPNHGSASDVNTGTSESLPWLTFDPMNTILDAGGSNHTFIVADDSVFTCTGTSAALRKQQTIRPFGGGSNITITRSNDGGNLPRIDGGGYANELIYAFDPEPPITNLTIDGFELTNNLDKMAFDIKNGTSGLIVRNIYSHDHTTSTGSGFGGFHFGGGFSNITIENCIAHDLPGEGFYFGTSGTSSNTDDGATLTDCIAYNCNGEAVDIKSNVANITIDRCRFSGCGSYPSAGNYQILIGGNNCVVKNTIISRPRTNTDGGIRLGGYWAAHTPNIGGYNNLVESCLIIGQPIGINLDGKNSTVVNCTFYDNDIGVQLDYETGSDVLTHTKHYLYNNVFHSNTLDVDDDSAADTSKYDVDYNSYDGTSGIWNWNTTARDLSYVTGTLGYEANNVANSSGDFINLNLFKLDSGSGLINQGDVTHYTGSYVTSPDIGWDQYSIDQNLVDASVVAGLWLFENSGNLGLDSSPNGNNLTNNNAATQSATSKQGTGSLDLESTSQQSLTISDGVLEGSREFSIGCWINVESHPGSTSRVIGKYAGSGSRSYLIFVNSSGSIFWRVTDDGSTNTDVFASGVLSLSTWYHIVGVFWETNMQLYVNGFLVSPETHYDGVYNSTASFSIGSSQAGTSDFDGLIDEAFYIDRKLEPYEVESIMNFGFNVQTNKIDLINQKPIFSLVR